MTQGNEETQNKGRIQPARGWTLLAFLIFGLGLFSLFGEIAGEDPREVIVINGPATIDFETGGFELMSLNDLRFVTALLSRNARTLVSDPLNLFQLEYCYPAENALAHGEAMISPSILGIPAALLQADPILTFNFVLMLSTLIAALSMFFAIREWTGIPAAGVVAGILFAFHETRMRDPVHFFVWDNAWTLLALVFAARLFRKPRWRDAVALAVCCVLQIGGSLYPLLVAVLFALPFLVWLFKVHGPKNLRPGMWTIAIVASLAMAFYALGPFLEVRELGEVTQRAEFIFLPSLLYWLEPGQWFFPGVVLLALLLLGLLSGRGVDRETNGGDPRWALMTGGLLCLLLATGGTPPADGWEMPENPLLPSVQMPEIWRGLAGFIPGLDVVRTPAALISGVHMATAIFAGFGTAALLKGRSGRIRNVLIVVVILAAFLDTLRPAFVGLEPRQHYSIVPVRPAADVLAFYERLDSLGNTGPLYEIDFPRRLHPWATLPILASEYHRRPTSACYNSFVAATDPTLRDRIPNKRALGELREMGFTTIVVHHPPMNQQARIFRNKLLKFSAKTHGRYLKEIFSTPTRTAFAIRMGENLRPQDGRAQTLP